MTYNNIDEAYKKATPRLVSIAKTYLYNSDYAIDCVHQAFEKALVYLRKHPKAKISDFLLVRETMAAVRRDNKHYATEVSRVIQDDDNGPERIDGGDPEEY